MLHIIDLAMDDGVVILIMFIVIIELCSGLSLNWNCCCQRWLEWMLESNFIVGL